MCSRPSRFALLACPSACLETIAFGRHTVLVHGFASLRDLKFCVLVDYIRAVSKRRSQNRNLQRNFAEAFRCRLQDRTHKTREFLDGCRYNFRRIANHVSAYFLGRNDFHAWRSVESSLVDLARRHVGRVFR